MLPVLVPDVIREIIINVPDCDPETGSYSSEGLRDLHSCIFVNREWCRIAMPILWQQPFHFDPMHQGAKVIEIYLNCLPLQEREFLIQNGINMDLLKIGMFNTFGIEEDREEEEEEEDYEEDYNTSSSLMALEFITNADSPPFYFQQYRQPMFNYLQFMRRLFYENFYQSAVFICKYLSECESDTKEIESWDDTRDDDDDDEFTGQAELLVKTILGFSLKSGARLHGLWFRPDSPYNDKPKYQLLENYPELFKSVKVLDVCSMFRKTYLFEVLGNMCHKIEYLHFHSLWSRHSEEGHIDQTAEVMHSFISSQQSLISFQLGSCKAYTRIFIPLLSLHKSTLKRIKFDQVDFRGCGDWTSIPQCEKLELLEITQCKNMEPEMVRPLITNIIPGDRRYENFYVRYIGIASFCPEFDAWAKKFERPYFIEPTLPPDYQQLGEVSGNNNNNNNRIYKWELV